MISLKFPSTSIKKNGDFLLFMISPDIPLVDEKIAHPGDSLEKVVIKYYILDKLIITISLENGNTFLGKSQLNTIKRKI